MHKNNTIHVCFIISDPSGSYFKHAITCMVSIFSNTENNIAIHIIVDETISDGIKQQFFKVCSQYNQSLKFYNAYDIPENIINEMSTNYGKVILFRLFIPSLILEDKVLYLDCDIICEIDISELFKIELGEYCLGAVLDMPDDESSKYIKSLGLDRNSYVNSGVLLFNNAIIRNKYPDFAKNIYKIMSEYSFKFPDQDAINIFFKQRVYFTDGSKHSNDKKNPVNSNLFINEPKEAILVLPEKYNYRIAYSMTNAFNNASHYKDKIIHFTCRKKPWEMLYPAALLYWHYYGQYFACNNTLTHIGEQNLFDIKSILNEYLRSAQATTEPYNPDDTIILVQYVLSKKKLLRWLRRFYQISHQGFIATLIDRLRPVKKKMVKCFRMLRS